MAQKPIQNHEQGGLEPDSLLLLLFLFLSSSLFLSFPLWSAVPLPLSFLLSFIQFSPLFMGPFGLLLMGSCGPGVLGLAHYFLGTTNSYKIFCKNCYSLGLIDLDFHSLRKFYCFGSDNYIPNLMPLTNKNITFSIKCL